MASNYPLQKISSTLHVGREGYEFNSDSKTWILSRDNTVELAWTEELLTKEFRECFIKVLTYFAERYSSGYTRNIASHFHKLAAFSVSERNEISEITSTHVINYRSSLSKEREWYLGQISGFLKKWVDLAIPGIKQEVVSLLEGLTIQGNEKGLAVRTQCPQKGAFTQIELESLQTSLFNAFETDVVSIEDFVLVTLFSATGRRPCQIGDLKRRDFVELRGSDGSVEYLLNFPRRKQQGSDWRESFKEVAVTKEIGLAIKQLISANDMKLARIFPNVSLETRDNVAIFPLWSEINNYGHQGRLDEFDRLVKTDCFHLKTQKIRDDLRAAIGKLNAFSERTGEKIHIIPTRFRRTLATRAAKEGYGPLVIAEMLDHTDDQNARVYTENVPEHVDAINEAMARQLAPLAQAFAGTLVDSERDAIRGNDLSSRVRTDKGCNGTCGKYGFCGASAPIACYTCREFQPWLDGAHEEILNFLLEDNERVRKATGDSLVSTINDRTILAVMDVMQRCEIRRNELDGQDIHD